MPSRRPPALRALAGHVEIQPRSGSGKLRWEVVMRKLTSTAVATVILACLVPVSAVADPINAPTTFVAPITCSNATTDESLSGSFAVNAGRSSANPDIITWSPLFITSDSGARYLLEGTSVSITITNEAGDVVFSATFNKNQPPGPWVCSTVDAPLGGGLFFTATATGNLTARG